MLRSFRVANHRSIREEQELVLLPAYDKSRPVLPVAGVFGANASGKSNLLDALSFMRGAVRTSFARWEAGSGIPRTRFRLDPSTESQTSVFAVDLLLDDVQYAYGFAVDSMRVVEEWLYAYPHRRKRVIFERDSDKLAFGSTVPDYRHRSELLTELTRENSLLLSAAAQANQEVVSPVYDWFRSSISMLDRSSGASRVVDVARVAGALNARSRFVDLVRAADLGINDIQVASSLHTKTAKEHVVFFHGDDMVPLMSEDESDGTLAWLGLLLDVVDALAQGSVVVVDEIDASLHPHLTSRLIGLFQDQETNPRVAQLIFTTHDASLLSPSLGDDTLQRDQVWFIEKDPNSGASKLFPLSDFHPRTGENTARRYLGGSYGAVPTTSEYVFRNALLGGARVGG